MTQAFATEQERTEFIDKLRLAVSLLSDSTISDDKLRAIWAAQKIELRGICTLPVWPR